MKPVPLPPFRAFPIPADYGAALAYRMIIIVSLCAILYFGRDVLIPIVLAILLSILLAPVVRGLQRIRFPKPVAVLFAVALSMLIMAGTAFLVARTLTNLAADLPAYEANLREKARSFKLATAGSDAIDKAAEVLKDLQKELERPEPNAPAAEPDTQPIPVEVRDTRFGPLQPVVSMIETIAHPMVQLGIVVLMLILFLFNREDLRNRLIRLAGTDDIHRTTLALDEAGRRLSRLFLGQLLINAMTGTFIGVVLFALGVPGAILWGLLSIVLRFIPFIGTIMGSVFPVIIALAVGDGWTLPFAVAATVIGAELVAGNVLEPVLLGRMTGVSSTAVVVSAAFWATLWGPIGLILAMPITIGLLVVGRHIEALRFFDIMLGTETVLSPDHSFYQRMLAGDAIEAVDSAQDFKAKDDLQGYLETVAVPALYLAQADQARGILTREKANEVATTFSEALEEIWSDVPVITADNPPVVLVPQHGVLNFAATVAFSALLTLKAMPHRMLPQDALAPGKFPKLDLDTLKMVCMVSLRAPSEAQLRYVERRIAPTAGAARIVAVAWSGNEDRSDVLSPSSAVNMMPASPVAPVEPATA